MHDDRIDKGRLWVTVMTLSRLNHEDLCTETLLPNLWVFAVVQKLSITWTSIEVTFIIGIPIDCVLIFWTLIHCLLVFFQRATINDFERFKLMKAKQAVSIDP